MEAFWVTVNADLGYPKFHIPMWKQFHKIHSLTEPRKSQIKTNLKYFSGYIRQVAAARWKKLFPRLLWWSEWEWPLRLICLTIWSTVGGTFEEGL